MDKSTGPLGGSLPTEIPPNSSATLRYLDIPLGGANLSDKLPLVIAIHGLGDTPENFSRWLLSLPLKVRLIVPQAPTTHGRGFSWFAYRPQRSEGELADGMARGRDRVIALVDQLEQKYPGLPKPAVLGFSQGGMLSFALAARYPDRFSLVLPLSGTLPQALDPPSVAVAGQRPTIHAFHGEADGVVPIGPTAQAVDRLKALGYRAKLERYPGVAHQIPDAMREAVFADLASWLAAAED